MAEFKVGDRVRMKSTCSGCAEGGVYYLALYNGDLTAQGLQAPSGCTCQNLWVLVENNSKNIMSTLIEKFRLARKGEPEKSFIKAGILDMNENFTQEGYSIFKEFLLSKFGDEFKKEVVDPILEEMKEGNK